MTDFWISIVSGFCFFWGKRILTAGLYPLVRTVVCQLEGENDELVDLKAGKAAAKAWNTLYHAGAALGAYMVMRGKPWQPWFLGGMGELSDGFLNMPFSDMD